MDGFIGLNEWCKEHQISRQWACKLCVAGRIPGAKIVDGWRWVVPVGSPRPPRLINERLAAQRDVNIREAAERRARQRDEVSGENRERIANAMLNGWEFDSNGSSRNVAIDPRWRMPASWWTPACWAVVKEIRDAE